MFPPGQCWWASGALPLPLPMVRDWVAKPGPTQLCGLISKEQVSGPNRGVGVTCCEVGKT